MSLRTLSAAFLLLAATGAYLRAGETATTAGDDKLLATVKKNIEIEWDQWPGKEPGLKIKIAIKGKAASLASACGELKIDEFLDENGDKLAPDDDDSLEDAIDDASTVRGVNDVFGRGVGLVLKMTHPPKFKEIRSLKGSLALQTGGTEQEVAVKNPFEPFDGKIDNKELSALGISLTLERTSKEPETRPGYFGSADEIQLNGKWQKNPIVRCAFFAANGRRIEAWSTCCGAAFDPHGFIYTLGYQQPLPDGAELHLTIHKDRRKARIPFEFKDVKVPVLEKTSWSMPVEKKKPVKKVEGLRPGDPLLADMTISARAEWCQSPPTKRPALRILFQMTGRAASLASQKDEAVIKSIKDENGQPIVLKRPAKDSSLNVISRSISPLDRTGLNFCCDVKKAPAFKKISELQASIVLRTAGRVETVVLKDFPKEPGDKTIDASLKSLGITVEAERKQKSNSNFPGSNMRDELSVSVTFVDNPVIACEIIDAEGNPIESPNKWCWGGQEGACSYSLGYWTKLPPEAKIRIRYHKGGRIVRVPITCKDIAIPPVAANNKTATNLFPQPKVPAGTHPLRVIFSGYQRNVLSYLASEVVRKELSLSDAERRELDDLIESNHSLSKLLDENSSLTDEECVRRIKEVDEKCEPSLEKLLTPSRMDRLCEIVTQIEGPYCYLFAYDRNRVMKLFGLAPKQMEDVEKAVTDVYDAMQASCHPVRKGSKEKTMTREALIEAKKRLREIEKDANERILKVFTSRQLEKHNHLKGKEIDAEKAHAEMSKAF